MLREIVENATVNEKADAAEEYLNYIDKGHLVPKIEKINKDMEKVLEKIMTKHKPDMMAAMAEIEEWVGENMPKVIAKIKKLGLTDEEFDTMMGKMK